MIQLLRERVAELAALDPTCTLFGASRHRYRFNPIYPDAELDQLERAHGFRLPEDYRAFITTIGNGGAGPSYGVIPFRGNDSEDFTVYETLGTPFAYQDTFDPNHLLGDNLDENDEEIELTEEQEDEQAERQEAYWAAFDSTGALYLCHHGCATRSLLIVSGPCRGQIWADDAAHCGGYRPETNLETGVRLTFTSWYMAWLDRAFRELGAP